MFKLFVRSCLSRLIKYAFSPSSGCNGLQIISQQSGEMVINLVGSSGVRVATILLSNHVVRVSVNAHTEMRSEGNLLISCSGSSSISTGGVSHIGAKVLTVQDSAVIKSYIPVEKLGSELSLAAERSKENASKLQANMMQESCHA